LDLTGLVCGFIDFTNVGLGRGKGIFTWKLEGGGVTSTIEDTGFDRLSLTVGTEERIFVIDGVYELIIFGLPKDATGTDEVTEVPVLPGLVT